MPNQAAPPLRASVPPLDPRRYAPSPERPLRAKARRMAHHMDIQPHSHTWGQLVFSVDGAVRIGARGHASDSTYLLPPSRAVWIPPGTVHSVTAVQQADLRTVYMDPSAIAELHRSAADSPWHGCRVLEVTPLLRELVLQLAVEADPLRPGEPPPRPPDDVAREQAIATLLLDELRRAPAVPLGLPLPQDKRLRQLCEAMLAEPMRHADLEGWAEQAAISPRTLARLFKDQLGSSYSQWRQQLLLGHALSLAARKQPMRLIAAELGYASPSAFTAMVKRAVGMPPSQFFAFA
ncbi:MAG TPA: helix-turn-helix transcriptional regulator [Ideonella sp.]|uniref:AraC family transcriptional regulator n=1 Tax=Ideonella sp. TaxID=1929293 RepID=UPI002B616AD4|nr:helix-turn-helix transcriptional regulator [Ideonella sp.]HSI50974.1 helix-turn-helix transcriptional regulator [Ideonella sp.]